MDIQLPIMDGYRTSFIGLVDCDALHSGCTAAVAKLASNDGGLPC